MISNTIYLWKRVPVLRLLMPLAAGITLQWHKQFPLLYLIAIAGVCAVVIVVYHLLSVAQKWKLSAINGIAVSLLFVLSGAALVYVNDIRRQQNFFGNNDSNTLLATLQEPLVEKQNSYKAIAAIQATYHNDSFQTATGNIIVYFKKDTSLHLEYGSQIMINKPLQQIKNSGNPGSFDYQQYCLFQGITHQAYLSANDFVVLPGKDKSVFKQFIYQSRQIVLHSIRKYVTGEKEQGLAEALLIGYKDDLDKNLVQSYSNTGVVHIIAISGLHVGLIYGLLLLLTKPLKRKKLHWMRLLIILSALWVFSIIAGGQPSVLRSTVMFTFIALAEVLDRRTSIYNSLALSAFVLLCYNPYWLWDVGFQLSYAAVLSIIIFFRPIYNWFYFPNKTIDFVWKSNAVTMAAQIFTVPISLYHFHQFPNLFLLTNLVAVPLSSIILIGEIILCALSFLPLIAQPVGTAVALLTRLMNDYIERFNNVSFALWNGIYISLPQTVLLSAAITGISYWLMEKKKNALWFSLCCLLLFISLRTISFVQSNQQQKLIVYNVPKHQAIDIMQGRKYFFIGDSNLLYDDFLRNFHLQPSRILHRVTPDTAMISNSFQVNKKRIAIMDTTVSLIASAPKPTVAVLILSKNPKLRIASLNNSFHIQQVVIDGSVPAWKAKLWKRDCDSLHIPCHDVTEQGAFVMNL